MAVDPEKWLDLCVGEHLIVPVFVSDKDAMRDAAKECIVGALDAGISILQLKGAAGGDLEAFLLKRNNKYDDEELQAMFEAE
jgi:hypothetical protein